MIHLFRRQRVARGCLELQAQLLRVALSCCHDICLAEDLTQDCIEKALRRSHQLQDINKLKSWLMQILANNWQDYLRRRHEHDDIDSLVLSTPDNASDETLQNELSRQVQHAIAQLPLAQRQVVTLVDLYGSSYQEVADILSIPVGTVMSRLSRARASLASALGQHRTRQNVTSISKTR